MDKEQIVKWVPIEGVNGYCYIESIYNDADTFRVILIEEDNDTRKIQMTFDSGVRSYRVTDELFSINVFDRDVEETIDKKEIASPSYWSFLKLKIQII